jgi:MFS family permease
VNAVSFAAVLIVLIVVRPTREVAQVQRRPVLIEAGEGVRALSHPVIRTSLLLTGMLAGLVIPVGAVLLPLLIRARGWSPVVAGVTLGAQSLGSIAVALVISRRGAHRRPGLVAILGLFLTVLALELLAFASTAGVAVSSGVLLGAGISLFTSHTAPLILGQAPITHLARVQAVLSVIQSAMLALTTPLLGLGSSQFGAPAAITACGALLAVGGIAAAFSRPFRSTHTESPQPELA